MSPTEPRWCDGDHLPGEGHHAPETVLHGVILARTEDPEDGPSIRLGTQAAIPDTDAILTPQELIEFGRLAIRTGKAARRDHQRGKWTSRLHRNHLARLSHSASRPLTEVCEP